MKRHRPSLSTESATWHNTIASVLSTNSSIFLSGFEKFQQPGIRSFSYHLSYIRSTDRIDLAWWTLQRYAPPSKSKLLMSS